MINNQEYITTELKKMLEQMIMLNSKRLQNLIYIVIGIITSKSVVLSEIAQELKDCYSTGTENSKIKRIYRFFSNDKINSEFIYYPELFIGNMNNSGDGLFFFMLDMKKHLFMQAIY